MGYSPWGLKDTTEQLTHTHTHTHTHTYTYTHGWGRQCIFFFFWSHCGILVPRSWIKPVPPVVEVWNPNHWTTREFWGGSVERKAYEIVIQEHVAWVGPEGHQY